jgi:CBS domain-containing protein
MRLVSVKWAIWAIFLGSGTSGGVLAPLLMIGSAVGGLLAPLLPDAGAGFWALVAMGAVLGGTMRSPLTGVVFAVELSSDHHAFLPLLVAATIAHACTVLTMRRSILTEKVARRGFHVSREYAIDPLEVLFVRDAMQSAVVGLPASAERSDVTRLLATKLGELEPLYPILDGDVLVGVVTRRLLLGWTKQHDGAGDVCVADIAIEDPVVAHPDEPLTVVVARMARTGRTRLPVVTRAGSPRVQGLITLAHLLKARHRHAEEEDRRERVLRVELLLPAALRPRRPPRNSDSGRPSPPMDAL